MKFHASFAPAVTGLFLLAALAGCVADPPGAGTDGGELLPSLPIPAGDVFHEPVLVGPGGDAETSLYVHDDGTTVLACAHGGFRIPSPLWASTDGGLTFKRHHPEPNPVPSGDCDVTVLDDGSWVMIYDTIASTTVAVSGDEGASWDVNFVTSAPVGGVDRPWVLADGNDILLTWANVIAVEPALHFFARSTDHGQTWTEQRPIAQAEYPDKTHIVPGHLFAYDDGDTIRVPLARTNLFTDGNPFYYGFATSRDGGVTWSVDDVLGPVDSSFAMGGAARAPDGTLYYSISRDNGSAADIEVLWSFDDGETWSEPVTVATGVNFPGVRAPWIDARSDGAATLAWLHEAEGDAPGWQAWAARVDAHNATQPVRFLGNVTEPVNQSNLYEFIMVRHSPDDRAHVLHLVTGEGCADEDPLNRGRSVQCVWLVSEAA